MSSDIMILIAVVVFLIIIVAAAIPFLLQLKKTLNNINITLMTLNQHLPGILSNVDQITTNVRGITGNVDKQVEGFVIPVLKIQTLLLNLIIGVENTLPKMMKLPLFKAARNFAALKKGINVFFDTLVQKNK